MDGYCRALVHIHASASSSTPQRGGGGDGDGGDGSSARGGRTSFPARRRRTAVAELITRIVELDKYRALALMGLPFAQRLAPQIDALSNELQDVIDAVGGKQKLRVGRGNGTHKEDDGDGDGDDARAASSTNIGERRKLLEQLCRISAAALQLDATSRHRFSASSAYSRIIDDRIAAMSLHRLPGYVLGVFSSETVHGFEHPRLAGYQTWDILYKVRFTPRNGRATPSPRGSRRWSGARSKRNSQHAGTF